MLDWLLKYYPLLFLALNALGAAFLFWMRNKFALKTDHEALATRVTSLENTVSGLPKAGEINQLKLEMQALRGDLREVNAHLEAFQDSVKGVRHQLNLLLENELRG